MRILFAGTPEIAVPSLRLLNKEFEIVGVLTNPDRATGRGRKIHFSPVKEVSLELNLLLLQADSLNEVFLDEIRSLKADLLVVIAYGKIFKKDFLEIFPLGGINLHPSLLPKYRGPSPISEAIKNGDSSIGITVQKLALKMDSGDILVQSQLYLNGDETTGSLSSQIAQCGAPFMLQGIEELINDPHAGIKQNDDNVSFCKLINKNDGLLDWNKNSAVLEREIRAFSPWPGSYTFYGDKKLNILEAHIYEEALEDLQSGTVLKFHKKNGIIIKTKDSALAVTKLQLQSKKPMDYISFVNGNRNFVESILGNTPGENI